MPVGHDATKVTDPLALDVEVLERARMPGGEVGSKGLKLTHGLRVVRATGGVHRERPPAPLALWHVGHVANSDVAVEPVGMPHGELQPRVSAGGVPEHEDLPLAELPAQPRNHLLRV